MGLPGSPGGEEPAGQCWRQEIQVRSLGWENLLEEGMAAHSSILAWRIPWIEDLAGYSPRGRKESDTTEATSHTHTHHKPCPIIQ